MGQETFLWVLLFVAAATDLLWGKIYNALTFPFFFLGIGVRIFDTGIAGATIAGTSVLVAVALFLPLYMLHTVAAGDVKLLMAFAAWSSFKVVVQMGMLSIVIGALVGVIVMLRQSGFKLAAKSLRDHWVSKPHLVSHRIPFAPAFLCAFLFLRVMERHGWILF